jgi:hypothetical protein
MEVLVDFVGTSLPLSLSLSVARQPHPAHHPSSCVFFVGGMSEGERSPPPFCTTPHIHHFRSLTAFEI